MTGVQTCALPISHWAATEDSGLKLAVFSTMPAMPNTLGNLLAEVIGTAMLVLGILFLLDPHVEKATPLVGFAPMAIGILVTSIGMSLGGATGFAINPARDLGPRIAHALLPIAGKGDSGWSYSWIPIVGPILGAVVGAAFYSVLWT